MFHGLEDLALEYIQIAAAGVLVDLDWLEHCPLFSPLRQRPEFDAMRVAVRGRAEGVWAAPRVSKSS